MKCPKCSYLGFEPVERCRNCGYEFSLAASAPLRAPDLPLRGDPPAMNPLDDLSMVDAAMEPASSLRLSEAALDLDRVFGAPEPPASPTPSATRRAELPLFGPPIPDDEPLITKASPPRQPLAVRRATPETPKLRSDSQARTPSFDLALEVSDPSPLPIVVPEQRAAAAETRHHDEHRRDAGVGARLLAVLLDLAILAAIDAV